MAVDWAYMQVAQAELQCSADATEIRNGSNERYVAAKPSHQPPASPEQSASAEC